MDPSESHLATQSKKRTQRTRSHNWSADQTTIMLNLLREEQVTQRVTSQGSFTKQVWNKLAPILSSHNHSQIVPVMNYNVVGKLSKENSMITRLVLKRVAGVGMQ